MDSDENPHNDFAGDLIPEHVLPVGDYEDFRTAMESGLVILSMGHGFWYQQESGRFTLYVEPELTERVTTELSKFEQDQIAMAKQLDEAGSVPSYPVGYFMPWLYIALLLIGFWLQIRFHPWVVVYGSNSARHLIEELNLWRPVTALFLHGDGLHLLKNAVSGLIFGSLVAGSIGSRKGWGLILLAGIGGNVATALMRPIDSPPSIGASTAVFGALGILTAYGVTMAFRSRRFYHFSLRSKLVPLVFGLTILAMQGMGSGGTDDNTDVLAHVNGFAMGVLIGAIVGLLKQPQRQSR